MALSNLLTLITLFAGSGLATAVPAARTDNTTVIAPSFRAASSFKYRLYTTAECDHSTPPDETHPPMNEDPAEGQDDGECYQSPDDLVWNYLETDPPINGVIAFINSDCTGYALYQDSGDGPCYEGLYYGIGSFKVIQI